MSANDLQQSLLDSMQLLSQNAVTHDNSVKSIKATIVKTIDEGLNTYTVSYGGNQFEATASSTGVKYQTGDIVYVLIPDGDFSQKKLIIGAVAARATMYSSINQNNSYRKISDNLITSIGDINLKSWIDTNELVENLNDFGNVFSEYLQSYRTVLFSAKVRTDIDKDHQVKGNYGIILNLPFIKDAGNGLTEPVNKILVMDVDSMPGNPYAFMKEQTVNLYFDIESGWTYDLTRQPELRAMVNGFGYLEPKSEETEPDIYFKDITFQIIEETPAAAFEGYSLSLVATKGRFFLSTDEDAVKTLTPTLYLDGNETSINNWECYWLVEDASIKINSEGYLPLAGMGWKCINNKTNITYDNTGKEIFNYVTNKYSYLIYQKDIRGSLKYKCLLAQDEVVVSTTIEIKNLARSIETLLVSSSGSTVFPENTGNINLIARLYYPSLSSTDTIVTEWQRFDKDGNNIGIDTFSNVRINDKVIIDNREVIENEISYPCSSLDQLNLIKCTFYCITTKDGKIVKYNLGTAQISVTTSNVLSYRILINNGDVIYKYDADGDSPLVANYDGPISSKVKNILPISYRLFKEDGTELTTEDYDFCKFTYKVPVNSMIVLNNPSAAIDGYYYITGHGQRDLNYSISPIYNKIKNDNTIILTLEYAGNVISEAINIRFIKDGESGTNGTKYAAVIKYNDYAYGEKDALGRIRKLQAVYVNGIGWKIYNIDQERLDNFNSQQLSIEIYKDGIKDNLSNYIVTWEMFDSVGSVYDGCNTSFSINTSTAILTPKENWTNNSTVYANIVQAKIKISNGTTYNEELYAYYPIEVTKIINSSYANTLIPTLDGGYSEVIYATDGTNPAYDNSIPFVCTNNINDNISTYYNYNWDSSINLKVDNNYSRETFIKPISKYDNGNSNNWIRAILSRNSDQQILLDEKIVELNNEIEYKEKEKNYYETIKPLVLDIFENFSYNNYISSLDFSKLLLLNIKQGTDICDDLEELGSDILYYCNREDIQQYIVFDINSIITNNFNQISQEKTSLHSLIKGESLDNLIGLQNCIINLTESMVTDISIYYQVKAMIDRWNQLIAIKYLPIYQALTRQDNGYVFQLQLDNLKNNFYNALNNYVNNTLIPLTEPINGRDPDQVFINLKNNIFNIIQTIDTVDYINSYADLQEKILQYINSLIYIYSDINYQENYYNNIILSLEEELENIEKDKSGYDKADIMPTTVDEIIHIKPIIMLYNRYEFSNLNGWDGNKLYTDSNNSSYLLAPQVGAGRKNNDGSFTGIVIGNRKITNSGNINVGLFGYGNGTQTIFLDANTGNAIFGSGNNTIEITPNSSIIHFGDSNGKIYSGYHDNIDSVNNGFYLGNDGLSLGYYFKVDKYGTLSASNGVFSGTIEASDGTIGGFIITEYDLHTNDTNIVPGGSIRLNASPNNKEISISNQDGDKLSLLNGKLEFYNNNARIGIIHRISNNSNPYHQGLGINTETWLSLGYTISGGYHSCIRINDSNYWSGEAGGWSQKIICFDDIRMATGENIYFTSSLNTSSTNNYIGPLTASSSGRHGVRINVNDVLGITHPSNTSIATNYLLSVQSNSSGNSAYFYGKVKIDGGLDATVTKALNADYATKAGSAGTADSAEYATEAGSLSGGISWNDISGKPDIPSDIPSSSDIPTKTLDLNASGNSNGISFANASDWDKAARMGWVDDNYEKKDSDERIKTDILSFKNIESSYMKLKPVSFRFKPVKGKDNNNNLRYGLIAQDVMKIYPISEYDMVTVLNDADGFYNNYVNGEYYGINYNNFHALHIYMIQKQQKEIEQLKQDNIYLKGELEIIKQKLMEVL